MEERYKISRFRVLKIECNIIGFEDIARQPQKEGIMLSIAEKITGRKPKNSVDKIIQLEINTIVTSDEVPDLKIELLSQAIFSFSDSVEDIETILENECYPLAKAKVYDAITKITETMGVPPIDLNKQRADK